MDIKPLQVKGIACISTAAGTLFEDKIYKDQEDRSQVLFVEHLPSFDADFIGFDYEAAGRSWRRRPLKRDTQASAS